MPPTRTLSAPKKPNVRMLNVDDLQVSELNIRMDVMEGDREEVADLAKSVSEIGLQNALVVRQIADQPGRYEVIEGSRRLRAVKELGWKQVQCDIREFTDQEAVVASLHENLVHGEVDASEIARGIRAYEAVLGEGHSDRWLHGESAKALNWYRPKKDEPDVKVPDVGRVKEWLSLGDFQNSLPGMRIMAHTKYAKTSRVPVIPYSNGKKLHELVAAPQFETYLTGLPQKARTERVLALASAYQQVETKHRKEFTDKVLAEPAREPSGIASEIAMRAVRSQLVAVRCDPELYGQIVLLASRDNITRSALAERALRGYVTGRLGVQTVLTPPAEEPTPIAQ